MADNPVERFRGECVSALESSLPTLSAIEQDISRSQAQLEHDLERVREELLEARLSGGDAATIAAVTELAVTSHQHLCDVATQLAALKSTIHRSQHLVRLLLDEAAGGRVVADDIFEDLRLSEAIVAVREAERRRTARDIHDGPAQVLANALYSVQMAERVAERDPARIPEELARVETYLRDGIADVRRLMSDLRPTMLQEQGLLRAIASWAGDLAAIHGLDLELVLPESAPVLEQATELGLFRMVQEAVQNAAKHAGDRAHITVELAAPAGSIVVIVTDSGYGFDPRSTDQTPLSGSGLGIMAERAALLNARLEVHSAPGAGTRVTIEVPVAGGQGIGNSDALTRRVG